MTRPRPAVCAPRVRRPDETTEWFAAKSGLTVDAFEARRRERLAVPSEAPELDLRATLRHGPTVGADAGTVRPIRRVPFTLVVSLPRLRVWVARGDAWERAERAMGSEPVVYEVFAKPPGLHALLGESAAEAWLRVTAGEVPVALFEEMARALWAAHGACSAPMQRSA